jgi:t-SNARE complex subunit (syntaxin)
MAVKISHQNEKRNTLYRVAQKSLPMRLKWGHHIALRYFIIIIIIIIIIIYMLIKAILMFNMNSQQ